MHHPEKISSPLAKQKYKIPNWRSFPLYQPWLHPHHTAKRLMEPRLEGELSAYNINAKLRC